MEIGDLVNPNSIVASTKIPGNVHMVNISNKLNVEPNAILEYFASKIPVISTDVGGCKEIIKNKKNGLLVSKCSTSELSKAILYIYKNKNIATKFSDEGFKTVEKKFTLNKMIDEHEKEYLKHVNP